MASRFCCPPDRRDASVRSASASPHRCEYVPHFSGLKAASRKRPKSAADSPRPSMPERRAWPAAGPPGVSGDLHTNRQRFPRREGAVPGSSPRSWSSPLRWSDERHHLIGVNVELDPLHHRPSAVPFHHPRARIKGSIFSPPPLFDQSYLINI